MTPEIMNKLVIRVIRVRNFFVSFFLFLFFITKVKSSESCFHFVVLMAHAIDGAVSATCVDSAEAKSSGKL